MDDYQKLKLFSRVIKNKPDFLERNFAGDNTSFDSFEELRDLLGSYSGVLNIDPHGEDLFRMYELIKFNYDTLLDGKLTKENFINPPQQTFSVNFQEDYTEWGIEYGSAEYNAANKDLAVLFAKFDDYDGNFDYDFDNRESYDGSAENFMITDATPIDMKESIKKSIKRALKEQYSIFIKKHI